MRGGQGRTLSADTSVLPGGPEKYLVSELVALKAASESRAFDVIPLDEHRRGIAGSSATCATCRTDLTQ